MTDDPLDRLPADHGSDRYDYVELVGAPEGETPEGLRWYEELVATPCQDCRANVFVYWRTPEAIAEGLKHGASASQWSYTVAHDDGCPWLAAHERGEHG